MASMSSLKMISSLKLSHSSSSTTLQTQKKVGSSLFQSLPTKTLNFPATLVAATSRRSTNNTTTTAFFFNNQKQHQDSNKPAKVQELFVYEINERDRGSPAFLRLSQKPVNSLGDLVPFSNKIYSGNLEKRLGITAGLCVLIQHVPEKKVTDMRPFTASTLETMAIYLCKELISHTKTHIWLLQEALESLKLFYTFYLNGIPDLPADLLGKPVEPSPKVEPSPAAKAAEPQACITNFTN
ncbi:hypothetical protein ACSQ67_005627 [Phaseolus vulgaris]